MSQRGLKKDPICVLITPDYVFKLFVATHNRYQILVGFLIKSFFNAEYCMQGSGSFNNRLSY